MINKNKIAKELLEMLQKDQDIRKKWEPLREAKYLKLMREIDKENQEKFKEIFKQTGFITSDYGKDAQLAAFLIVQHMPTTEIAFMKDYLKLMKDNIVDVNPDHYALLTDRTRNWEGKLQLYGTQYTSVKGELNTFRLNPIYKPRDVDKRRAEIGLEPLDEYMGKISEIAKIKLIV